MLSGIGCRIGSAGRSSRPPSWLRSWPAGRARRLRAGRDVARLLFLGLPVRAGGIVETPVAVLGLDTPAVADTTISVVVSEPLVATVPGNQVTIPTGQQTAPVPVTAMEPGDVTLSATLEATTLHQPLKVGPADQVPEIPTMSLAPDSVTAGESSTATVLLDFLAPPGGTTLTLASDNPEVGAACRG